MQVHRFRDRVGLSLPSSRETDYLTKGEARQLANALLAVVDDMNHFPNFAHSRVGTVTIEPDDLRDRVTAINAPAGTGPAYTVLCDDDNGERVMATGRVFHDKGEAFDYLDTVNPGRNPVVLCNGAVVGRGR